MGIVSQYGLPLYHSPRFLSIRIFHNSEAQASFFCAFFDKDTLKMYNRQPAFS